MKQTQQLKIRHSLYLMLAAFLWGTTFVAQSMAMDTLGPYTYNTCRFFVGALVLLVPAILTGRSDPLAVNYRGGDKGTSKQQTPRRKALFLGGFLTGLFLFLASSFQQVALVYTTAGKCGFVTALYIIFVPIFAFLLFRHKCSPLVIAAIAVAIVGFYFLCIKEGFTINRGDLISLAGAVMFAFQILAVDVFAPRTSPVQLSCMQFVFGSLFSLIPTALTETPTWTNILACAGPILYAGILSCGVAYTLQIIGQRGLNPTIASLFMSLESVISAIAGWIVLGDVLSPKEILGCCLVFAGVILAQIPSGNVSRGQVP